MLRYGVPSAGGETILFGLKLGPPVGQGAVPTVLLDDAHDLCDGFRGFGKLAVEPIGFLPMGAHGLGGYAPRHHALGQSRQHAASRALRSAERVLSQPLPSTWLVQT